MRVLARISGNEDDDETASFPGLRGEKAMGGRLRRDAFERSKARVSRASEVVTTALLRRAWGEVVDWLVEPTEDPEALVRLAVVRPGFCEGCRGAARARLEKLLRERRGEAEGVVVVEDVEQLSGLTELLLGVVDSRPPGVVVLAASHWTVPSSLPEAVVSRLSVRVFEIAPFDAYADAVLERLLARGDLLISVGPRVLDVWRQTLDLRRDVGEFVKHVHYVLLAHFFERPHSFAVVADSLEVAARETGLDLDELRSLLLWRKLANLAANATDAALRTAAACDAATSWKIAVSMLGENATHAKAKVRRALGLAASVSTLATVLGLWREALVAEFDLRAADAAVVRLLASRLFQLEAVANEVNSERRAQLEREIHDWYAVLADQASNLPKHPLARLVFFDDADVVAKPFAGGMWSAAVAALNASTKDPRCLAFQVASDELHVDLARWYKLLQERTKWAGLDHHQDDNRKRSCDFVCAVRDLAYTGLVRDHTKRGKYMVCGT